MSSSYSLSTPLLLCGILLLLRFTRVTADVTQLNLCSAEPNAPVITTLVSGTIYYLSDLPSSGVSVVAMATTTTQVVFSVNTVDVHAEDTAPFYLMGKKPDNPNHPEQWTPPVGNCIITATQDGKQYSVSVVFAEAPTPNPAPPDDPDSGDRTVTINGELKQWHTISLLFLNGPYADQTDAYNPFRNYRFAVNFTHVQTQAWVTMPGHFAADGNAADSASTGGRVWRCYFNPWDIGAYIWNATFVRGYDVAYNIADPGEVVSRVDGLNGTFDVQPSDKQSPDFRARGYLQPTYSRYLYLAGSSEIFLKNGANSPENFLAYYGFENTFSHSDINKGQLLNYEDETDANGTVTRARRGLHEYPGHLADWKDGDPTWRGGNGKEIIGAVNYLSSKKVNSQYTVLLSGQGQDVWPWTEWTGNDRYDVCKLDQWHIVFQHQQSKGIACHFVLQELQNSFYLDDGNLGVTRSIYYRELISRYAHLNAIEWNLGEEIQNTIEQIKSFATFFHSWDPYNHPVTVHTTPDALDSIYGALVGYPDVDGMSLQRACYSVPNPHAVCIQYITRSQDAGKAWFCSYDEQNSAQIGVERDGADYWHDSIRQGAVWGSLMAGGVGVEYYFGYDTIETDLSCEDFRSRDHMFDLGAFACDFFANRVPNLFLMQPRDELVSKGATLLTTSDNITYTANNWLMTDGDMYIGYIPRISSDTTVNITDARLYSVRWYNPRLGGDLQQGSVDTISAGGVRAFGLPPLAADQQVGGQLIDWVVVLTPAPDQY